MMRKIMNSFIQGVAAGGVLTFIYLTILTINNAELAIYDIWLNASGLFLLSIYAGIASLLFEHQKWSILRITITHLSVSIIGFFIIAVIFNWFPLTLGTIITSSLIFVCIYMVYWTGFWLHYKKVEATMNEHLPRK